jgi:hypothetical protein
MISLIVSFPSAGSSVGNILKLDRRSLPVIGVAADVFPIYSRYPLSVGCASRCSAHQSPGRTATVVKLELFGKIRVA